jgi:3-oxoacyl-[acyl-carrier protein] reductase
MDLQLAGKVAMVSGSSRGLGYAVARALAAEGCAISMVSRQGAVIGEAARQLREQTGAEVLAMPADVSVAGDVMRWCDATEQRFGGIDLLFTNGGGPPMGAALSFDGPAWEQAAQLLVFSTIGLVKAAVPSMQRRGGGAILMSTSSAVKEPIRNLGLSTVMRASVSALAKTLSIELAPANIRVNQIVPGRVDTDRVRSIDEANGKSNGLTAAEQKARSLATIPMGRYGTPEEFGQVATFLLSGAAGYVTGATLQVDGGMIRSVL